jgi:4-hydroxy-2-oxoheptanedioate aldolase
MPSTDMLRARLATGAPAFTAWCGLPEPMIAGLLAREPFDAVTLDMQHGFIDFAVAMRAIPLIVAAGKPAIVRIPVAEFATASRLLDAGAAGIIAPMINTADDARRLAAFTKFPPVGERSWGPAGALALTGLAGPDYAARANGFSVSFAMIETREALANLDAILAVDGIDAVLVGPSDLSLGLSKGASLTPESAEVDEALARVLDRVKAAGKFAAIYAASGERAAVLARRGWHLTAIAGDGPMLSLGARSMLDAARR